MTEVHPSSPATELCRYLRTTALAYLDLARDTDMRHVIGYDATPVVLDEIKWGFTQLAEGLGCHPDLPLHDLTFEAFGKMMNYAGLLVMSQASHHDEIAKEEAVSWTFTLVSVVGNVEVTMYVLGPS